MNILEKIIVQKIIEVEERKAKIPETALTEYAFYGRKCLSLCDSLLQQHSSGIIAEFKRKSPSKGFIHEHANAAKITGAYTHAGAAGLSVLTDEIFFGGHTNDLLQARVNNIPVLRKDFIIDTYQITEAKAMGADVILLIAACLSADEVNALAVFAHTLGMEVLLEIHEEYELGHICKSVDIVGINNRNLKTFAVDVNLSLQLGKMIPGDKIKIAESGIDTVQTVQLFKEAGFKGFLMGEVFMKEKDPGKTLQDFIKKINKSI